MLNVSRPFLTERFGQGAPPYRKVSKHRRVCRDGLLSDKVKIDHGPEAALD